jgi:hypothetical protein
VRLGSPLVGVGGGDTGPDRGIPDLVALTHAGDGTPGGAGWRP